MDVQNHLKTVCLEVSPIIVTTIQLDGKMTPSTGVTTPQIHKIVRPVTGRIWKGAPRVYHAQLVIMAGVAPMGMPLMKILIAVKPVMVTQLHRVQIVIIAKPLASTVLIVTRTLPGLTRILPMATPHTG